MDKDKLKDNNTINNYDTHYQELKSLQPIEVMQLLLSEQELSGFLKGNILKYTLRAGHKEGEGAEKDLAKAQRYRQWLLQVSSPTSSLINPRI